MNNLTVLIPVYNGESYLAKCVQSIVHQQEVYKVIIHDDASTDQTSAIAKELESSFPNVNYIRTSENMGSADAAIGAAMDSCTSTYFTWIGVDDYFSENAFAKLTGVLQSSDADYVYCDFDTFGDLSLAPQGYGTFTQISKSSYFRHFHETLLNEIPWNGVWKTSSLRRLQLSWMIYEGVSTHSDVVNGLHQFTQGLKVLHVPEKLIHYHLRQSSGTHDVERRFSTLPHLLKNYYTIVSIEDLCELHNCAVPDLYQCAESHCKLTINRYKSYLMFSPIGPAEKWSLESFISSVDLNDTLAELHERVQAHV